MEAIEQGTLEADLLGIFLDLGSAWVLYLLLGLSAIAVGLILERIVFYLMQHTDVAALRGSVAAALSGAGVKAALDALKGRTSLPASVARTCLEHVEDGAASVEEHAASVMETERLRYERGLAFLGTLGSNAPFIGLFGTVLGIIRAFNDLALESTGGAEVVMAGIAEALVATAVGLLVALPAVAAYNVFTRHVERSVAAADSLTHAVLAHMKIERRDASAAASVSEEG